MGLLSSSSSQGQLQEVQKGNEPEQTGSDIAVILSGLAVLLAAYQFLYQKNRLQGLYIGLWPPTIMGFANYLKAKSMERRMPSNMLKQLIK